MEMIHTSYFGKYRGDKGVSIARWTPNWFVGERFPLLAPPDDLLKWWKSLAPEAQDNVNYWMKYVEWYKREVLKPLEPYIDEIAKELDHKVLLCYEKPENYCHRHIVADWFWSHGYECWELEY